MTNKTKIFARRRKTFARHETPTLLQLMTPRESRQARDIAYQAALSVIG
ncbi:hypothetical protein H8M03_08000 [Sphingomonas sabuli]|uniref:Uncharacterized protein n=1 Tax=Sphingomonas sabuli TaxID=2764186 RepID=A0A7G9L029_9SPHN|nr:hypothetical protein [Sphingomonas sabuli]QNM81978.1 hypothetical protein H8M03_08000 [Sphingomonas sabuli]